MLLTKSPQYFVQYYYITQILYILLLYHPFSNLHACHLHFVLSTSYPVMYNTTKWSAFTTLPSHCSWWFLFQSGWLPLDLHRISPLPSPFTAVIISNNSCFFHNSPSSLPDLDFFQIQVHVTTVLHVVRCIQYCRGCKFTPTVNHVGVLSTHDQFRTLTVSTTPRSPEYRQCLLNSLVVIVANLCITSPAIRVTHPWLYRRLHLSWRVLVEKFSWVQEFSTSLSSV